MRAAVTPGVGSAVSIESVDDPQPRSGEVLVRVHGASVNRLDRMVHDGLGLGRAATFPLIQGIDAAGVVAAGSGSIPTGSRVVVKPAIACRQCRSCRAGRSGDCERARMFGIHRQGGFAELLAVPRTNLALIPAHLTFTEAAAAAHTHAVVLTMMRRAGDVTNKTRMLVTGAAGALGTGALQLGTALGADVVGLASSEAKRAAATALGARVALDAASTDVADTVREATDGGVDLVLETTGSAAMITAGLASLARGGALVLIAGAPGTTFELDAAAVYQNRLRVIGSAGSNDRDFSDVYRLMAEHDITPVIASTFGLDEAQAAMEAVRSRDRIGKVVIDVGGEA